jgi:FKBP-type peptidyl-prolyl cis-trans isomerase
LRELLPLCNVEEIKYKCIAVILDVPIGTIMSRISRAASLTKNIETKELSVGTGEEATKDSIVAVNVREFLRRGGEVSPSPMFGPRMVIELGRRDCIAGLRYGIPVMRVGGIREIVISPHLAYGEAGIPGRIPANALLRCQVELI